MADRTRMNNTRQSERTHQQPDTGIVHTHTRATKLFNTHLNVAHRNAMETPDTQHIITLMMPYACTLACEFEFDLFRFASLDR